MPTDYKKIDKESQTLWSKRDVFRTKEKSGQKKFYVLDMFPYPSGEGLHVGHIKGYFASDIVARFKLLQGYDVLHPMGWDAFGLPAENYALKTGQSPAESVKKNIENFKKQMTSLGLSYDWSREINTTDPDYYKWTQWIFLQMFKEGLAYQDEAPINFCPSCKTGLANEEVIGGVCERCGTQVKKKRIRQWMLRITSYAEKLLENLEKLDWPQPIKDMQTNWIGRSEGTRIRFDIKGSDGHINVFTTRADTLFGATYLVLAPEHELINKVTTEENRKSVHEYQEVSSNKSDLQRTDLAKEKTGVFTGSYAINPINGREIPIWIADYVLFGYGTGAVMAVPAHDERDFDFATKYKLPIETVIIPEITYHKAPPREEKEWVERTAVESIIYDPSKNKYLCLAWKKQPWIGFVTGGVKEGETHLEAALREIKEETGLVSLKFIKELGSPTRVRFYAAHKDINRMAYFHGMYFELEDEKKVKVSNEEKEKYNLIWLSEEEITDEKMTCASLGFWKSRLHGNQKPFVEYGHLINSGDFSKMNSKEAIEKITQKLKTSDHGDFAVGYKLHDWVFSRQRYWGEPIPIIHCDKCGDVPVPEKDLPVRLPEVENFAPSGTGESPLSKIDEWVNTTCPKCGGEAKRETNTMPQWAGSCWYYLRYISPNKADRFVDEQSEKYFMPVDLYIGGAEHAVLHLLYARFWHRFLYDMGYVSTDEPFQRLKNVGLILAPDRQKMSKSRGNVINPTDLQELYGVDSLRMYEMFIGPFDQSALWSTNGISGTKKFVDKVVDSFSTRSTVSVNRSNTELDLLTNSIADRIDKMHFNTAISDFMTFVNKVKLSKLTDGQWEQFLIILSPFAPHVSEYLWQKLHPKNDSSIFESSWPKKIETKADLITYVLQVNAKKRSSIDVKNGTTKDEIIKLAMADEKLQNQIGSNEIKKTIFIDGKLINFLV